MIAASIKKTSHAQIFAQLIAILVDELDFQACAVLNEGADIFLDFFTIHELQKSCVSIPENLSDVVSSYQARVSYRLRQYIFDAVKMCREWLQLLDTTTR